MTHMCNRPKFTQLTRPNPAAQSGVVVKTDHPKTNDVPLLLSSVLKKQPETTLPEAKKHLTQVGIKHGLDMCNRPKYDPANKTQPRRSIGSGSKNRSPQKPMTVPL